MSVPSGHDRLPTLRPATAADLPAVVALNRANQPEVGPLTEERAARFLAMAELFLVAVDTPVDTPGDTPGDAVGEAVVGFVIVLAEGCDYDSPNYGWFSARFPSFAYVDRVAVAATYRGRGLGRALYDAAVDRTRAARRPVLCAEVNVEPRNDVSLAFHERYGFRALDEVADPRYETLRVVMLVLDVA